MELITQKQAKIISFLFFIGLLFMVFPLGLFPCLFAGLLIYEVINIFTPFIERFISSRRASFITTVIVSTIIIILMAVGLTFLVRYLVNALDDVTHLREQFFQMIEITYASLHELFPNLTLSENDLHQRALDWLKNNLASVRLLGKDLLNILSGIVIGLILGALVSVHKSKAYSPELYLRHELHARASQLAISFSNVVFAQVKISSINTIFTSIYLIIVLPIFDISLPFTKTLILLTFIFGLLPVIGNIISNVLICVSSFIVDPTVAIFSLLYLIIIHKLEYFLNAKIIGTRIQASAWEILLVMFLFKALFGIAGIIAAPIYYAYIKKELTDFKLI